MELKEEVIESGSVIQTEVIENITKSPKRVDIKLRRRTTDTQASDEGSYHKKKVGGR